jgi:Domain of unknown function (DUF1707)
MVRAADQRVSDSERDEVVDLLRRAAGEGRIGHDELDERVARALRARTYRELNLTIADIPRPRAERRTPVTRGRKVGGWALTAVRNEPWLLVFVIPMVAVALTLMLAALMMWMVVAIAMLALGGHHRQTAQVMRHRRPMRGPRGLAGSAGRWV